MQVTVRLFAAHREAAGRSTHIIDLPEGATAADAYASMRAAFPPLARATDRIAYARNREHVAADTPLHDGDEVALLPPVAGG